VRRAAHLLVASLLVASTVPAGPPPKDLNGDGRVDLADVRLLARMVAGLDPANPAFDQNGDGRITMDDVEILTESADMESGNGPAVAAPVAAPSGSPGAAPRASAPASAVPQFLVVRQASDGRVVVVVGEEGVRPGDRILSVHATLAEATAERNRLAGAGPAVAAPPPRPAVNAPPPQFAGSLSAESAPAVSELVGTVDLVGFEPGRALAVVQGRREGWVVSEVGRSGRVSLVRCDLGELARLGDPVTPPAPYFGPGGRGDALFVFLPFRGDGRILKGIGRGAVRPVRITMVPTLQGRSGGIVVVPRRGKHGETTAVYLYHWPSGTALYASGLATGSHRLKTRRLGRFPVTAAEPVIVPVLGRAGATRSFTVLDPGSGGVRCVLNVRPHPANPRPVSVAADLSSLASPGIAGALALAAAPLMGEDGRSSDALVVEGRGGRIAVLEHHDDPARLRLRVLGGTLDGVLPASEGPRRLVVTTLAEPGAALVLDGASGRMARVVVGPAGAVTVTAVRPRG